MFYTMSGTKTTLRTISSTFEHTTLNRNDDSYHDDDPDHDLVHFYHTIRYLLLCTNDGPFDGRKSDVFILNGTMCDTTIR